MLPASMGNRGYSDLKATLKQNQKAIRLIRTKSSKMAILM